MEKRRVSPRWKLPATSRLPLLVAGTGAAHAILFLIGAWLLDRASRPVDLSDEALADYLAGDASRFVSTVGLNIAPFAGIFLLWFVAALRAWMGPRVTQANQIFLSVQSLSAVLYVAVIFVSAAALVSPLLSPLRVGDLLDANSFRILAKLAETLMLVFGVRCAAMVAITTSRLGLDTGLIPRWVAYLGFIAGAALFLSGPLSDALILIFPIWLLILSTELVIAARQENHPRFARGIRA